MESRERRAGRRAPNDQGIQILTLAATEALARHTALHRFGAPTNKPFLPPSHTPLTAHATSEPDALPPARAVWAIDWPMISSIELLAGAHLGQMLNAQQAYTVQRTASDTVSISLAAPALQAEGLHLQTWASSFLLANRLHRFAVDWTGAARVPILELGAGTGLVGLSAAAVWGAAVLLTDFGSIVPGTAANVERNAPLLKAHGASAICGSLDWKRPADLDIFQPHDGERAISAAKGSRARLILTADTLYTAEQPALLVQTILAWLERDPRARVLVSYPMRIGSLEAIQEFWERMESSGLESIEHAQERIEDDQWDDEKLHEWSMWRWTTMSLD